MLYLIDDYVYGKYLSVADRSKLYFKGYLTCESFFKVKKQIILAYS